jgi:hypothetical protein
MKTFYYYDPSRCSVPAPSDRFGEGGRMTIAQQSSGEGAAIVEETRRSQERTSVAGGIPPPGGRRSRPGPIIQKTFEDALFPVDPVAAATRFDWSDRSSRTVSSRRPSCRL